eukprot:gene12308-13578_t
MDNKDDADVTNENIDPELEKKDEFSNLNDGDDGVTLPLDDDQELNDQERIQLFEKGLKFKSNHSYQHALLCFLGCVKGLKQTANFPLLPNCLQNIASIYAKFEDFTKAVQFMQAAKLYYETAIIGTREVGVGGKGDDGYQTMDENATEEDAKKANEYEKLSHDCLKQKNINLALEYCGKSTQLRRKVYGENHGIVVKSLDLFTMIYAEMGKMQYTEAIGNLEKKVTFEDEAKQDKDKTDNKENKDTDDGKITQDVEEESGEGNEKNSHRAVNGQNIETENTDISEISRHFLSFRQIIFVIFLSAIVAVFITWFWCKFSGNKICPSYNYMSERLRYNYYYHVKSWFDKGKYI